jgi:hypothetical protein
MDDDEEMASMASQVSAAAVATGKRLPRVTQKAAIQRVRRSNARKDAVIADVHEASQRTRDQLSAVLKASDGILHSTRGETEGYSHATAVRIAMAPLTVGNKAVESLLGVVSASGVARLRVRVASSLRILGTASERLTISNWSEDIHSRYIESFQRAPLAICVGAPSSAGIGKDVAEPNSDSDMELVDCAISSPCRVLVVRESESALRVQASSILSAITLGDRRRYSLVACALPESAGGRVGFSIMGLGWKWDGTPIHASTTQRIVSSELGAFTNGGDYKPGESVDLITGQGAECFSQRGVLFKWMAGRQPVKNLVSIPPKDLRDKSAKGLLEVLELEQHIARLIAEAEQLASLYDDDVGPIAKLQFVVVVPLTVDAASVNLCGINMLLVKYRHFNRTNRIGMLVLIAVQLCLPHAVHIASRTVFSSVQLPVRSAKTGKKVSGALVPKPYY